MRGGFVVENVAQPQSDSLKVNLFRKTGLNKTSERGSIQAPRYQGSRKSEDHYSVPSGQSIRCQLSAARLDTVYQSEAPLHTEEKSD